MTTIAPIAALPFPAVGALGVVAYLVATALLLRLVARWAREAIAPVDVALPTDGARDPRATDARPEGQPSR